MANLNERFSQLNRSQQKELLKRLRADRYRENLYDLCKELLDYQDVGTVHKEIEQVLKKKGHKLVLIPRGHLKSSFVTVGYSIQRLLNNPNLRILITNATWENSRKFLSEMRGKITSEAFLDVYPEMRPQIVNSDEIYLPRTKSLKDPSVGTAGVGKDITGAHYDLIIMDDVVSKENVTTPEQIRKVIEYYQSLIPILEPDGEIVMVGTRWHEMDLYGHVIEHLSTQFEIYIRQIQENGKYIFPEKFNADVEDIIRANMSPQLFSSQYYNRPIAEAYQVFTIDHFKYYDEIPKNLTVINTTVDLARSESHDSDDTAIVTVGWTPESDMYILDVTYGKWTSEQKVKKIHNVNEVWHPENIGIEGDAQQSYFNDLLRLYSHMGYKDLPIAKTKSGNRAKEERIGNLEPLYRAGKVYHKRNAPWLPYLESQLLKYTPMGTHGKDDGIDGLSAHLQLYTPKIIPKKPETWIDKNKNAEKDLRYWANAVIWEKEARIKEINKKNQLRQDEFWLNDIESFASQDAEYIFDEEMY